MFKHRFIISLFIITGFLFSCHTPYTSTKSNTSYYEPGASGYNDVDSVTYKMIYPYQTELNKEMNQVLANSISAMEKGKPESLLGNFVADACMNVAAKNYKPESGNGIDFCILNNGGLRSSLPSGAISRKNVFELMPFENELVVLTMPGNSVTKILKYISDAGGVPVSNLRMKISSDSFTDVFISGQPFNPSMTYKLVTSDYLANGGDAMQMLSENIHLEQLNIKVRDAIIDYMISFNSRSESLNPVLDGRISK